MEIKNKMHFHCFKEVLFFGRVRDFWSDTGPADVLAKVQRKQNHIIPGRRNVECNCYNVSQLSYVEIKNKMHFQCFKEVLFLVEYVTFGPNQAQQLF